MLRTGKSQDLTPMMSSHNGVKNNVSTDKDCSSRFPTEDNPNLYGFWAWAANGSSSEGETMSVIEILSQCQCIRSTCSSSTSDSEEHGRRNSCSYVMEGPLTIVSNDSLKWF